MFISDCVNCGLYFSHTFSNLDFSLEVKFRFDYRPPSHTHLIWQILNWEFKNVIYNCIYCYHITLWLLSCHLKWFLPFFQGTRWLMLTTWLTLIIIEIVKTKNCFFIITPLLYILPESLNLWVLSMTNKGKEIEMVHRLFQIQIYYY